MRKRNVKYFSLLLVAASTNNCEAVTNLFVPVCISSAVITDSVVHELDEIFITADSGIENIKNSTPVHTLDAREMLITGVTDITDAMRRLPGINLKDYGGSGGMKTVSVRGLGAQHTGVIYDGAPVSDIQTGQIDLSRYSLDNVSSLTLNIGEADDIYQPARSGASASTLSITTLRTPDMLSTRPELKIGLRAASFLTLNPSLRFAISNGKDLGMSISGEFTHAKNNYPITIINGDLHSEEKRNNSQMNLGHAEWNGIWKPTIGSALQAKIYIYDTSRHLPGPITYYNSVSHERLKERNLFGQLNYNIRLSDRFSLKTLGKFNSSSTRYSDENGIYPGGILDRRYRQEEEYVTTALIYRPITPLSISYAADYWHNTLRSNLEQINHPSRDSFLQAIALKWANGRVTAVGRLLWSIISDRQEAAKSHKMEQKLSPSASLSVKPINTADWYLRTSYKNIFRMPTFNELYFEHYGTINLNPEITDQFNLGSALSKDLFGRLMNVNISADGYINLVRNKIVAIPYNMFLMTMTNLGKVRILGFDATLSATFNINTVQSIRLTANYSYQRAASRTDRNMSDWMKQVAYTPLNSGSTSLSWENPWVNFVIHSTGSSARYTTNSNLPSTRIPGYLELGFTAYREFRIKDYALDVRADLINALDRRYEIIARYPMPGRSWATSLIIKF